MPLRSLNSNQINEQLSNNFVSKRVGNSASTVSSMVSRDGNTRLEENLMLEKQECYLTRRTGLIQHVQLRVGCVISSSKAHGFRAAYLM